MGRELLIKFVYLGHYYGYHKPNFKERWNNADMKVSVNSFIEEIQEVSEHDLRYGKMNFAIRLCTRDLMRVTFDSTQPLPVPTMI